MRFEQYVTGIDGEFMNKLSMIFTFDVDEVSGDYRDVATSALRALQRL